MLLKFHIVRGGYFSLKTMPQVLESCWPIWPCNLIKVRIIEVLETNVRPQTSKSNTVFVQIILAALPRDDQAPVWSGHEEHQSHIRFFLILGNKLWKYALK